MDTEIYGGELLYNLERPDMITTREEYDYVVSRGYEPLTDARFPMDIHLREEIQREFFGKNTMADNAKFYKWCIEHKPNICEECGKPIRYASATNVSHILTRGAFPEMAMDPRNVNILCFECHNKWEHSTTRKGMIIKARNERTIEMLKKEYNLLRKNFVL